jgi:hypothetical protein
MRRSLPVRLRDVGLASSRLRARFRRLLNDRQMRIQRSRFRRARHRMTVTAAANGRNKITPRRLLIMTQKANSQDQHLLTPDTCESPSPSKSIVASMSPTTQHCDHSPFRRRKSMSFMLPRNIKVIVFWVVGGCRWPAASAAAVEPYGSSGMCNGRASAIVRSAWCRKSGRVAAGSRLLRRGGSQAGSKAGEVAV